MRHKNSGKALALLILLLLAVAGAGVYIYLPKWQETAKAGGPMKRSEVRSALTRATLHFEDASHKWPQSKDDIKDDTEIKALDPADLSAAGWKLAKGTAASAEYVFTWQGKNQTVTLRPKRNQPQQPSSSGTFQ